MLRQDKINMAPQECLRSSYASVRILTNFLRTLRFSYKQLAESLANLLRMLQILKNAFTNVKNACERLKNETNTKRVLAYFVSLNLFASIHRVKLFYFVFVRKRQVSLACPSDEKRDNGKPDPPSLSQKYFQFQIFADEMHLLSSFFLILRDFYSLLFI